MTDAFLVTKPIYSDLLKYVEKEASFLNDLIRPTRRSMFGMPVVVHDSVYFPTTVTKAKEPTIYTNNLGLTPIQLSSALRAGTVIAIRDGYARSDTPVWYRASSGPEYREKGGIWQTMQMYPEAYSIAKPSVRMGVATVVPSVDYTKVDLQQVRLGDGYLVSPANPPQYLWFYNSLTQRAERHVALEKIASLRATPHLWFRNEPKVTPGRFVEYT
ncbi:hypothetical protein [Caulobacter phage BL198]|uniref:Uncharacterized protein n=1 Tax=Caulobacter phage BL198 TaxID=3020395 RepID=A0AAE9X2P1_9CAUD|nr:hypothetical protein [Caulobacter phage BL198]